MQCGSQCRKPRCSFQCVGVPLGFSTHLLGIFMHLYMSGCNCGNRCGPAAEFMSTGVNLASDSMWNTDWQDKKKIQPPHQRISKLQSRQFLFIGLLTSSVYDIGITYWTHWLQIYFWDYLVQRSFHWSLI